MKNALDFIVFALSHAKRESIPYDAVLPVGRDECGVVPGLIIKSTIAS